MTVSQLYALYLSGHREAWHATDGGVLRPFEIAVDAKCVTPLERLILELALHDATNGTPVRSLDSFEAALAQGAEVLARLGARVDLLDEAA